jgi:hypothetical protein
MSSEGTLLFAGSGGIGGEHARSGAQRLHVAPSTAKEFNTIRPSIFPIACWKADDVNFDFDSSFIQPALAGQMARFKELLDRHPGAPAGVFGHADPVGNDDYNKALSGRRAQAVYALLARRPDLWEELHQAGDWKAPHLQIMLLRVGFDPGRSDGVFDEPAKAAVKSFQESKGLANSGTMDASTRKALYRAYMDAICADADGKPYSIGAEMFLGGGKDKGGKGDYQGCGEFNPVLRFSKEEDKAFEASKDKTARNLANTPNRRVLVLLFRPGSRADVGRWPCPRAKEGPAACRKRFWSDHAKRRQLSDLPRHHETTRDTFECRFYQRLTSGSPCERASAFVAARLYDADGRHMPFAPYSLSIGSQPPIHDLADSRGFVVISDPPAEDHGVIEWSPPPSQAAKGATTFRQQIFFRFGADPDLETRQRLVNLGYVHQPTLQEAVAAFHEDYKSKLDLDPDGALGPKTRSAIRQVHDGLEDQIRDPKRKT